MVKLNTIYNYTIYNMVQIQIQLQSEVQIEGNSEDKYCQWWTVMWSFIAGIFVLYFDIYSLFQKKIIRRLMLLLMVGNRRFCKIRIIYLNMRGFCRRDYFRYCWSLVFVHIFYLSRYIVACWLKSKKKCDAFWKSNQNGNGKWNWKKCWDFET